MQLDLSERERAATDNIGLLDLRTGMCQSRSEAVAAGVRAWLEASGFDGAVWTDTPTNFESVTGKPFTVSNAASYLRALTGSSRRDAKHYIESAPTAVSTPLRRHLREQDWWHEID